MYVEYEFYVNDFGGDEIPEEKFGRMQQSALYTLNSMTMGRAEKLVPVSRNLKLCICELAEREYSKYLNGGYEVSEESTGAYSVSRRNGMTDADYAYGTIKKYLSGTGLLYRGGVR